MPETFTDFRHGEFDVVRHENGISVYRVSQVDLETLKGQSPENVTDAELTYIFAFDLPGSLDDDYVRDMIRVVLTAEHKGIIKGKYLAVERLRRYAERVVFPGGDLSIE